jgi:ribosomal-protein-serine acetyltransferase
VLELPRSDEVALRLLEERDADELHDVIDRHRAHLARWLPWARGQTREATLEFIRSVHRQFVLGDGVQTAIVDEGAIAGVVGTGDVSRQHEAMSIGYWLAEDRQGRGLMTAAVRAYLDAAFGPWGLNRVELRAAVENARSRAVAERLGFTREGVLREREKVGERRHDLVVHSMLAREWATRR